MSRNFEASCIVNVITSITIKHSTITFDLGTFTRPLPRKKQMPTCILGRSNSVAKIILHLLRLRFSGLCEGNETRDEKIT